MRKVFTLICAGLLCSCGGNSDPPNTDAVGTDSAITMQNDKVASNIVTAPKVETKTSSKPPAPAHYTHTLIQIRPSAYGGNCEIEGSFVNDGATPLSSIVLAYDVALDTGQKNRAIKRLSTAPRYGDDVIAVEEARPVKLSIRDTECASIASVKLIAFTCQSESADINCTTDSLVVDNQMDLFVTR
jgi:hypothetical protein